MGQQLLCASWWSASSSLIVIVLGTGDEAVQILDDCGALLSFRPLNRLILALNALLRIRKADLEAIAWRSAGIRGLDMGAVGTKIGLQQSVKL